MNKDSLTRFLVKILNIWSWPADLALKTRIRLFQIILALIQIVWVIPGALLIMIPVCLIILLIKLSPAKTAAIFGLLLSLAASGQGHNAIPERYTAQDSAKMIQQWRDFINQLTPKDTSVHVLLFNPSSHKMLRWEYKGKIYRLETINRKVYMDDPGGKIVDSMYMWADSVIEEKSDTTYHIRFGQSGAAGGGYSGIDGHNSAVAGGKIISSGVVSKAGNGNPHIETENDTIRPTMIVGTPRQLLYDGANGVDTSDIYDRLRQLVYRSDTMYVVGYSDAPDTVRDLTFISYYAKPGGRLISMAYTSWRSDKWIVSKNITDGKKTVRAFYFPGQVRIWPVGFRRKGDMFFTNVWASYHGLADQ